jgi:Tol biopolymer transport system component
MRSHFSLFSYRLCTPVTNRSRRLGRRFLLPMLFLGLVLGAAPLLAAPEFSEWSAPVNLGALVNSSFNDAGPALSRDGLSLYFQSNRTGGFGANDIWVSQRDSREDAWGEPVNLGPTINTASNEDAPCFSRDGHTMYFNSDRPGGFGMRDIWIARRTLTRDDFGWEEPVNAGPVVNSALMDAGPSYLANEEGGTSLLYFGSTRLGGVYDIYVTAQAADGSWGPAVLVPELSSPQSDQRPSVRFDGLELFLHSDRPGGVGLADLWVSTRDSTLDPWSAPVNLGATVNSVAVEQQPFIASDRETLFFASDRVGGLGTLDIYATTREKNPHE